MTAVLPCPPTRAAFWRAYWITLRPYLFFVSGSSGLLGLALGEPLGALPLLLAFLAFSASYGLGQALTDVFQTDTDALSAPYRPLVRGEIEGRSVFLVSLAGLGACTAVLAWLAPPALALGGLATLGLLAYTPAKRRFWAGPFWNSWIVGLLPAMGLLCASPSTAVALAHPALTFAALTTILTYACFVLVGYLKDVEADRATGYVTLPVRFGRRACVLASAVAAALGLAFSGLMLAAAGVRPAFSTGSALWTIGASLLLLAHPLALRATRDEDAHPGVAMVVRGYVLLRLGEVALLRAELSLPVLAVYALFEAALAGRPSRSQV